MVMTVEKARKKIKKVSERVGESVDDLDETALEGDLAEKQSITGEVEKSGDDDLSADLLQLMVPVAIEKPGDKRTSSLGDTTDDDLDEEEFQTAWAADVVHLPPSLEVEIRVHKGTEPLGISVDSVDQGVNGMLVVLVVPGGAVARDGHIHPGDYLISVNHETLRKVTNSQARAILRRAQLLSTDISVTYIPEEAAVAYRKSIRQDSHSSVESSPVAAIRRTSPRSPYVPSDSSLESSDEREKEIHSSLVTQESQSKHEVQREHVPPTQGVNEDETVRTSLASDGLAFKSKTFGLSQAYSLKKDSLPVTELPSDRLTREFSTSNIRKLSQTKSADGDLKQGPLSICVVDGLYSVHSPKGNKVLVGIELSRKDKFQSDLQKLREKTVALDGAPKKKVEESEVIKSTKDVTNGSQEVKSSKKLTSSQKTPVRGKSLDIKTQSEVSRTKVEKAAVDEALTRGTEKSDDVRKSSVVDVTAKTTEKFAKDVADIVKKERKPEVLISQVSLDGRCLARNVNSNESSDSVRKSNGSKKGNEKEVILVVSSDDSQELKSKRKVIQTRVPSFECTCEKALDDTSPDQMCSCISPSGHLETVLDIYSDNSKRSCYHSAEVADVGSNQTSQELTVYQELANTESIFSSGDEFRSGTTSPFYSPKGDSPEPTTSTKNSSKMDKEVGNLVGVGHIDKKKKEKVSANILLAKHWGQEREVEVVREHNCSLGISIVGGKVDLYNAGPDSSSAILGIFIKNVLPNSPAGLTRELKTGDRILEVDSIDLRNASHERAVEVIRGAGDRVRFLVQSLIQWNVEGNSESVPLTSSSPPLASVELQLEKYEQSSSPVKVQDTVEVTLDDCEKKLLEEGRRSPQVALDSDSDILEIVLPLDVDMDDGENEVNLKDDDDDDVDVEDGVVDADGDDDDDEEEEDENEEEDEDEDEDDDDAAADDNNDSDSDEDEDDDIVKVDDEDVDVKTDDEKEEPDVDEIVQKSEAEDVDEKCETTGNTLADETCGKISDCVTGQEGRRGDNLDEPDEFGYTLSKLKKTCYYK
ncbi:hypothetical protein RUM44_011332 [Polyplax serrata]|uniref:PDZ domain-containing protein n=1 Tax=Polyplax serrata TaxID=468196 RepID=A0ABR1APQ7_POLSC